MHGEEEPLDRCRIEPAVLRLIEEERERQEEKWGQQHHSSADWLVILQEEIGEVCQEILRWGDVIIPVNGMGRELTNELVQATAVLIAWLEDRQRQAAACEEDEDATTDL